MPSFAILFIVAITIFVSNNEVNGVSVHNIDSILDILKKQQLSRGDDSDSDSDSSSVSDTSDDGTFKRNGKADAETISDLLQYVGQLSSKKNRIEKRDRSGYKEKSSNSAQATLNKNSHRIEDLENLLRQLFKESVQNLPNYRTQAKAPKKRLTPNRLLFNGKARNADELEDYSKIYIVLSPKAVQQTKTRSSLNQLISKILTLPSSSSANQNSQGRPKQKRYKGFSLKYPAGRRRGSREIYAPNDSAEDKPSKRGRNSNQGGGHTAIPYIRHRGENIYEKEN